MVSEPNGHIFLNPEIEKKLISEDRRIAEVYSRGSFAIEALPEYAEIFTSFRRGVVYARL